MHSSTGRPQKFRHWAKPWAGGCPNPQPSISKVFLAAAIDLAGLLGADRALYLQGQSLESMNRRPETLNFDAAGWIIAAGY